MSDGACRRFNKEEVVEFLVGKLACQHLDTHLIKQVRGSCALRNLVFTHKQQRGLYGKGEQTSRFSSRK